LFARGFPLGLDERELVCEAFEFFLCLELQGAGFVERGGGWGRVGVLVLEVFLAPGVGELGLLGTEVFAEVLEALVVLPQLLELQLEVLELGRGLRRLS